MAISCSTVIFVVTISTLVTLCFQTEPTLFDFWPNVPMNKFRTLQDSITMFNCKQKPKSLLRLPQEVVSEIPQFNRMPGMVRYPNRTALIHVHNMALNRAFFFSYILQYFNVSRTDFPNLPGLLYIYLSAAADVTANRGSVNSSLLMYDVHQFYPNYFTSLAFNKTLNLYAIRAMRIDNTFQTSNFIREPTLNLIRIYDLGAQMGENYTQTTYRNAPWYGRGTGTPNYLPDSSSQDKHHIGSNNQIYRMDISWTPTLTQRRTFFGPLYPGQLETNLPVRFTKPWFDCGENDKAFNQWIFSAVSPVVDFMPRYAKVPRLQYPRLVAVAAMDTYFMDIPVNLCPISDGNTGPNLLAGSAICKPGTVCESMMQNHHVQFRRSSFQCRCLAGHRYPFPFRDTPWSGDLYRRATIREYNESFSCIRIHNTLSWPSQFRMNQQGIKLDGYLEVRLDRKKRDATVDKSASNVQKWENNNMSISNRGAYIDSVIRQHYNVSNVDEVLKPKLDYSAIKSETQRLVSTFSRAESSIRKPQKMKHRFNENWILEEPSKKQKLVSRMKRATTEPEVTFDSYRLQQVKRIFRRFKDVTALTCHKFPASELVMPSDAGFGASKQFKTQASMALRLAHFLSAYLQVSQKEEVVSGVRMGQGLHEQHIIAEAMANVAGDMRLVSSGVFFDRNKFVDSQNQRRQFFGPMIYRSGDLAAASFGARDLANFGNGYHNLNWFKVMKERWATNPYGLELFRVEGNMRSSAKSQTSVPFPYYPIIFRAPRYDDGYWSVPYFDCTGPVKKWLITYSVPFFGNIVGQLTFMGVVTATMELRHLDVNQCDGNFYDSNFFKSTALCHRTTTYCRHVIGFGFDYGSYSCHCRAGYEFPYTGAQHFYQGSLMQDQYDKMMMNTSNMFSILKCRQTSGTTVKPSLYLILVLLPIKILISCFY